MPLNWHAPAEDLAFVLRDSGATILVAHADLLHGLRPALPCGIQVISVRTPPEVIAAYRLKPEACQVAAGDDDWATLIAGADPVSPDAARRRTSIGIFYTSGTTGKPKGVVRDQMDPVAAARLQKVVDEVFGVPAGGAVRVLVSAPVYHGAPNFFANRGVVAGSLTVLQPRFEPEQLLQLVERYSVTHMYMVPTTMLKLLDLPADVKARYDLSSLRRIVHSAAPCPPDVKRRMIEWLGPVVFEFYGGTECGTITLLSSEDALRKPGSVGRLLQDCGLKVIGEDGRELAAGEVGEIFARNFNTPRFRYHGLPEKQAEMELGELVSIGDVGYVDEEGFVFLCDRKRDMIISAGVNIYPAELEAALLNMPGVADCIVFGIPDPVYGEAICAHVEPKAGASFTPEAVTTWMEGRVAKYQVPRKVVIDPSLPREESGKIMKRRVRDRYWDASGRRI